MSLHVDLLDFLRTGDFGDIRLGMTRPDLMEMLGPPSEWSVSNRRKHWQVAEVWRYGTIEFHFNEWTDVLWMIFTDQLPLEDEASLEIDSWKFAAFLPLKATLALLDEADLHYEVETNTRLSQTRVTLPSGVVLCFDPPQEGDAMPHKNNRYGLTGFWVRSESRG